MATKRKRVRRQLSRFSRNNYMGSPFTERLRYGAEVKNWETIEDLELMLDDLNLYVRIHAVKRAIAESYNKHGAPEYPEGLYNQLRDIRKKLSTGKDITEDDKKFLASVSKLPLKEAFYKYITVATDHLLTQAQAMKSALDKRYPGWRSHLDKEDKGVP